MATATYGFSTAGLAEIEQQLQREEALTGRPASKQRRKALYEAYLSSQAQTAASSNIAERQFSNQEKAIKMQEEAIKRGEKANKIKGIADIGTSAIGTYKLGKEAGLWGGKAIADTAIGTNTVGTGIATQTGVGSTLGTDIGAGISDTSMISGVGESGIGVSSAIGTGTETAIGASGTGAAIGGGASGGTGAGTVAGTAVTQTAAPSIGIGSVLAPVGWGMAGSTAGKMLANTLKVEDDVTRVGMGVGGGAAAGFMAGGPIGALIGAGMGVVQEYTSKESVICTELHRQGILSDELYLADCKYVCQHIDDKTYDGYYVWAKYIANGMAKSKLLTTIVKPFAMAWAKRMAGKDNLLGDIILKIGVPVCRFIGKYMLIKSMEVA